MLISLWQHFRLSSSGFRVASENGRLGVILRRSCKAGKGPVYAQNRGALPRRTVRGQNRISGRFCDDVERTEFLRCTLVKPGGKTQELAGMVAMVTSAIGTGVSLTRLATLKLWAQ